MGLYNYTIEQVESMLHNKEISAEELAKLSLDQIDKVDNDVKAFLTLNEEEALKKAKQLDENGDYDQKLAGVPGAIKDNIVTDRKSTRLNSSHVAISYAVFCLKKKRREHEC